MREIRPQNRATVVATLTATISMAAILSSCGSPSDPIHANCALSSQNLSCAAEASHGEEVNLKLTGAKGLEEYGIVVLSRAQFKQGEGAHGMKLRMNPASSAINSEELAKIAAVQNLKQMGNPYLFSSATTGASSASTVSAQDIDLYIPNGDDYLKTSHGTIKTTGEGDESINVPGMQGSASSLTGAHKPFQSLAPTVASPYEILYQAPADTVQLNKLSTCLQEVMPPEIAIIGKPVEHLNSGSDLRIVVTELSQGGGKKTIGLFNSIDRFLTKGGAPLDDSNKGEYVYVSNDPQMDFSRQCATGGHEYEHQIRFDHTSIEPMPVGDRTDLQKQLDSGLKPEERGLDEGLAHIFEELTGKMQMVDQHVYNFLNNPQNASFTLETAQSALADSITRGINTLFLYYAIKRVGGTLSASDPATADLLSRIVLSHDRGYENIAKQFQTPVLGLFQDFFQKLMLSLYSDANAQAFLPNRVINPDNNVGRGTVIVDRASNVDSLPQFPAVHPYQFDFPTASAEEALPVSTGGVRFRRFIVPNPVGKDPEITISGDGSAYDVFIVKLR